MSQVGARDEALNPRPRIPGPLLALALLLIPASCPPRPPTPVPTPKPTPTPPPLAQLLLRQPEPPRLERDGVPFVPFGAIQCCMGSIETASAAPKPPRRPMPFKPGRTEALCNTLWPLASECWMDWTHAYGANVFHFRLAPWYARPGIPDEDDWDEIGGPMLGDGPEFNPAFWRRYRELLDHARSINSNVEIVVYDTWYGKTCQWGTQPCAISAEAIDSVGRRPNPEIERFIRKAVAEACDASHVVWIVDNEGDQIQGDTPAWYDWVRTTIRDAEQQCPTPTVRMIGTNNPTLTNLPFDYFATHAGPPLVVFGGRFSENNEHNDPSSPEAEHAAFCQAQGQGLHWWFWRAEMNAADMERTLDLFGQGCGGPVGCFPPDSEDPLWVEPPVVGGGMSPAIRQAVADAKVVVGERCGTDHAGSLATIELVAAELRRKGHCAGRGSDALSIADGTVWKEIHVVTFASGCWSQDPANYPKATWTYAGTNPTPPPTSACVNPPAQPVNSCAVKEHTKGPIWTTIDSTFKVHDAAYCAAIGFTDGRIDCPVRQEGDPLRATCEAEVVGTPVYSTAIPGAEPDPSGNPYLFRVPRGQSGPVTVYASKNPAVSCTVAVTP